MSTIKVHFSNRSDLDAFYCAAEEHLSLHHPESNLAYQRRDVIISCVDARDVCESLVQDGILDPEVHDYQIDE